MFEEDTTASEKVFVFKKVPMKFYHSEKKTLDRNKTYPPIFVIGSARSGTSILSKLIREYLNVSFGTESQFIVRIYRRLHLYGNLKEGENLKNLLSDIGKERCFQRWRKFGYKYDFERIYARIQERSYAGVLDAIFSDLATHTNRMRWGDKTPEYVYDLDILYHLFPYAKFIHIVRDGRDVALSNFKVHFGAKNIGMAALEWHRQMECVIKFRRKLNAYQFFEIRYEDFLEDPISIFMKLMSFLEIDDANGKIQSRIEEFLPKELKRGNCFKWKTQLERREQEIFEHINFHYLHNYNYTTITKGDKKVSKASKFLWKVDHRVKQLRRLDTWTDNFYKFNVRFNYFKKKILHIYHSSRFSGKGKY